MRRNSSEKSGARREVLDSRLNGYSAGAKIPATVRRLRSRIGNWPVYAAAAGSALAMTTSASASIISGVYTGFGGPHGGVSVHPQADGQSSIAVLPHLEPLLIKARTGTTAALSVLAFQSIDIFVTGPYNLSAKNFAAGAPISGAGMMAKSAIVKTSFSGLGSGFGRFVSGQPGYVGFAIGPAGGNVDYGWLKLVFMTNPDTQRPYILEALAWGLETTPNTAINAGATATASPEPGTMALGILAAGAAGVVALRRRRQSA